MAIPAVPTAFPMTGQAGLLGDMPVRLCAEGDDLVAYGFGHQRVVMPASVVGVIRVRNSLTRDGKDSGSYLVVHSRDGYCLLVAPGSWGPGLSELCQALHLPKPDFSRRQVAARRRPEPAPRLRVRPPGWVAVLLASILAGAIMAAAGALAGVALTLLLPTAIGSIRDLVGIALAIAGCMGGTWLFFALRSVLRGTLRWLVTSIRMGGPAPYDRFIRLEVPGELIAKLITAVLVIAVPLVLFWGVGILADSVSHALSDSALVSQLRQNGVTVEGQVVSVPQYSTDSNGNTVVTFQVTLEFTDGGQSVQVPDPAIAGRLWPVNPAVSVPIVYDQADPQTAAVWGQITGSVWHGAPTGNVIGGSLGILSDPLLIWLLVRRFTAARRKAARELTAGLA